MLHVHCYDLLRRHIWWQLSNAVDVKNYQVGNFFKVWLIAYRLSGWKSWPEKSGQNNKIKSNKKSPEDITHGPATELGYGPICTTQHVFLLIYFHLKYVGSITYGLFYFWFLFEIPIDDSDRTMAKISSDLGIAHVVEWHKKNTVFGHNILIKNSIVFYTNI